VSKKISSRLLNIQTLSSAVQLTKQTFSVIVYNLLSQLGDEPLESIQPRENKKNMQQTSPN